MELAMNWYGKGYLEASVGSVVRRIINEKVAIEVDPIRSARASKDQEKKGQKDQERLIFWCGEVWNSIYNARGECPRCVYYGTILVIDLRFLQGAASAISTHSPTCREEV